jgi:hypothetical protein
MKKVLTVLVLTLASALSAFAGACSGFNTLQSVGNSCAASIDGTVFSVSLIGLTNPALTPAVNINVTASEISSGTDRFSIIVAGVNSQHFSSDISANFQIAVSGNAGAAVTSVKSTVTGFYNGADLTTNVVAPGSSLSWDQLSSSSSIATSNHAISPSFVSAEVDTGLNFSSGISLTGYTETFTVIWTASTPSQTSPPPVQQLPPPPSNNGGTNNGGTNNFVPLVPVVAPEPASLGLMTLAGVLGGLFVRRRVSKR